MPDTSVRVSEQAEDRKEADGSDRGNSVVSTTAPGHAEARTGAELSSRRKSGVGATAPTRCQFCRKVGEPESARSHAGDVRPG